MLGGISVDRKKPRKNHKEQRPFSIFKELNLNNAIYVNIHIKYRILIFFYKLGLIHTATATDKKDKEIEKDR